MTPMFAEDRAEALRELLTDPATDPADRAARGRRMLGEVRTMRSLGETPGKRLVYGWFMDGLWLVYGWFMVGLWMLMLMMMMMMMMMMIATSVATIP